MPFFKKLRFNIDIERRQGSYRLQTDKLDEEYIHKLVKNKSGVSSEWISVLIIGSSIFLLKVRTSVADPDHFDADTDPTFHFDTGLDPACQFDTDPVWLLDTDTDPCCFKKVM
jgi:hypothetical protein